MPEEPHRFVAPILFDPAVADGYMKHYVALPAAVDAALGDAKRFVGALDDVAWRRTLHRRADGRCLKFGLSWLKDAGFAAGDLVEVTISVDPDPDRVDLPPELEAAFEAAPDARWAFIQLTPGKQRTLIYPVLRAKKPETKARRAAALVAQLQRR